MAREVIQLETDLQLRQNNRKKGLGKGLAPGQGGKTQTPVPGPRPAHADKDIRMPTAEVAEGLKKRAEAKLHLENERKEKTFRDAMVVSPLGGLYGAASVAEHEEGDWEHH